MLTWNELKWIKFDNVDVDQVVVVLVGTNNHGHTPDMIASGVVAIVQLIREKQPQAHVVAMVSWRFNCLFVDVMSSFPSWWINSRCSREDIRTIRLESAIIRRISCWPSVWPWWNGPSWSRRTGAASCRPTRPFPTWICTTTCTWLRKVTAKCSAPFTSCCFSCWTRMPFWMRSLHPQLSRRQNQQLPAFNPSESDLFLVQEAKTMRSTAREKKSERREKRSRKVCSFSLSSLCSMFPNLFIAYYAHWLRFEYQKEEYRSLPPSVALPIGPWCT